MCEGNLYLYSMPERLDEATAICYIFFNEKVIGSVNYFFWEENHEVPYH